MGHRMVRLILLFLCACGISNNTIAQTEVGDYNANYVINSLMSYPLPTDDIFWQGEFEEVRPDDAGVVRQPQVLTHPGIISYRHVV